MNEDYNGVEIQVLPKIGEAERLKTNKQGRRINLKELVGFDPEKIGRSGNRSVVPGSTVNIKLVKITINTIIHHSNASEKQKQLAKEIGEGSITKREAMIIFGMAKRLKRKD